MARYNTVLTTGSIAGGNSITTPSSGLLTTLTGSGTVTIPNPVYYLGSTQTYYNSTASAITLSVPGGSVITGPGLGGGSATLSLPPGSIITLVSDGTNYLTQDWVGGNVSATTLSASGAVNLSPASSTITINPGTASNMDNMIIGATTAKAGTFTTLTATTSAVIGPSGTTPLKKLDVRGAIALGGSTDGIWLGNVGDNSAYDNVTLNYTGYNSGSPYVVLQPRTTPGSGILTTFLQLKNSNGNSATANNLTGLIVDSTIVAGANATTSTGYGSSIYAYKDVSNISNGGQEGAAAGIFGKANATGETSVFIGADQGTTRYGYIGAVNRSSAYTGLVLQPAGGNVGIGPVLSPTALLNVGSGATDGATIHLTEFNTTGGRNGSIVWRAYYSGTTTLHDSAAIVRMNTDDSNGASFQSALAFMVRPSGAGQSLSEKMRISSDGSVVPGADNAQNLGSTSLRWANLYTGDLHLSNEGSSNSIDGTSGNWTIQEGKENLFIINNKTGKKYEFMLREI
jgi:hypothetical protein